MAAIAEPMPTQCHPCCVCCKFWSLIVLLLAHSNAIHLSFCLMCSQSCARRPGFTSLLMVSLLEFTMITPFCQAGLLYLKLPRTVCQPALLHPPKLVVFNTFQPF